MGAMRDRAPDRQAPAHRPASPAGVRPPAPPPGWPEAGKHQPRPPARYRPRSSAPLARCPGARAPRHGFTHPDTISAVMGHPSVSFTVPSLGDLLVRELKLAGLEIDLDDHQSSENSPEYYERLAIRVEERHGADVPGPSSFVLRGQPKRRRRRRYSEVPPAVRCVLLARALIKVCALERERALFQGAAEIGPMHSEMNDLYKRRREGLTTEINKLDALGVAGRFDC